MRAWHVVPFVPSVNKKNKKNKNIAVNLPYLTLHILQCTYFAPAHCDVDAETICCAALMHVCFCVLIRLSGVVRKKKQKTVPARNSSRNSLWIILSKRFMITEKRHLTGTLSTTCWVPFSSITFETRQTSLWPFFSKTQQLAPKWSRLIKSTTSKRNMFFWFWSKLSL